MSNCVARVCMSVYHIPNKHCHKQREDKNISLQEMSYPDLLSILSIQGNM